MKKTWIVLLVLICITSVPAFAFESATFELCSLDQSCYGTGWAVSSDGSKTYTDSQDSNHIFRIASWNDDGEVSPYFSPPFGVNIRSAGINSVTGTINMNQAEAFKFDPVNGLVNLGLLPGDWRSDAYDISADGTVVVGVSQSTGPQFLSKAFRWTQSEGMTSLLGNSNFSLATGISADGSVIVGHKSYQAFRWTQETGAQLLGFLPGDTYSIAHDISNDGVVTVGQSCHGSNCRGFASIHNGSNNTMISLGNFPNSESSNYYVLKVIHREDNEAPDRYIVTANDETGYGDGLLWGIWGVSTYPEASAVFTLKEMLESQYGINLQAIQPGLLRLKPRGIAYHDSKLTIVGEAEISYTPGGPSYDFFRKPFRVKLSETASASLVVTVNTIGMGSVVANPDGPYEMGQVVQLTAQPARKWKFDHWSGDLSGNENPAQIAMDGNKSITAHFEQLTPTPGGGGSAPVSAPAQKN